MTGARRLKSICVGLAFVLGALYIGFFLMGIVLRFVTTPAGRDTVGFFISLRSPIVWLPSLVIFACGYFWALYDNRVDEPRQISDILSAAGRPPRAAAIPNAGR